MATHGRVVDTIAAVAAPADKPPVLGYEPVESPEPSLVRRMAVGLLHVMPWLPLYLLILAALAWGVLSRFGGRRDELFTVSELLADLFVVWIVLGVSITIVRFFHRPRSNDRP